MIQIHKSFLYLYYNVRDAACGHLGGLYTLRSVRKQRPVLLTLQYYSLNEAISPTLEDYRLNLPSGHHFFYCADNLFSVTHE